MLGRVISEWHLGANSAFFACFSTSICAGEFELAVFENVRFVISGILNFIEFRVWHQLDERGGTLSRMNLASTEYSGGYWLLSLIVNVFLSYIQLC